MKRQRLWPLLIAGGLGLSLLVGLCVWQVTRLSEKQRLIATIDAHLAEPAQPLSQVLLRAAQGSQVELVKAQLNGHYVPGQLYMQASLPTGGAFQLITPFITDDGTAVLVDRGTIPSEMRGKNDAPPAGNVQLTTVVRQHKRGRGFFDPDNDVDGNIWFWWDVPALLAASHLPAATNIAPFIVQALPQSPSAAYPRVTDPGANIPNNHLSYAITWGAMAACLAVILVLLARQIRAGGTVKATPHGGRNS